MIFYILYFAFFIYGYFLGFKTEWFLKNKRFVDGADDQRPIARVVFRVVGIGMMVGSVLFFVSKVFI